MHVERLAPLVQESNPHLAEDVVVQLVVIELESLVHTKGSILWMGRELYCQVNEMSPILMLAWS